jgi:hypothetical protein
VTTQNSHTAGAHARQVNTTANAGGKGTGLPPARARAGEQIIADAATHIADNDEDACSQQMKQNGGARSRTAGRGAVDTWCLSPG